MEITTQAEVYSPSINENGDYIDKIPTFINGIRCPCGSRKDKVYETFSIFNAHTKTKCHQNWLRTVNLQKANYYTESEQLKELVKSQRLVIATLQKDLSFRKLTIDYLTKQLVNNNTHEEVNLIEFD